MGVRVCADNGTSLELEHYVFCVYFLGVVFHAVSCFLVFTFGKALPCFLLSLRMRQTPFSVY